MKAVAIHRDGARAEEIAGRILCHDVRGNRNEIVFRKGHIVRDDDVPPLLACAWSELHLIELEAGDLGQREAGERLAVAASGAGVEIAPSGHKHALRAVHDGLLEVDLPTLVAMNMLPGISIFTLLDGQVISAGQVVAQAQIAPLALDKRTVAEAERIAARGVIRVAPFIPRQAVIFVRERFEAAERDRALEPLIAKLRWFGCPIREVADLPHDVPAIRGALEARLSSEATLFVIAGSNALDPLDPIVAAIGESGATMQRLGMPVHPGTLLWLASLGAIAIIGLPSCGFAAQPTALDLVLPRILAHGTIRDEEIAALGHGGILNRGMAFRFPQYDALLNHETASEVADERLR
ncbi:MAG TPA: hypothetical protein VEZ11_13420 [Thermoanaerobaculia bacterium]|nr:hypothetical protein [Thermoanaerobaculia bacterium]